MIEIEENPILTSRAMACHKILTVSGEHSDTFDSIPEGLLCMMIALVFACKQYDVKPAQLSTSIKRVREMIVKAQRFTGTDAGVSEVVIEMGLN